MFAYIKYLFFSPMLFLNIHLLLCSEIPLNTQICLYINLKKEENNYNLWLKNDNVYDLISDTIITPIRIEERGG